MIPERSSEKYNSTTQYHLSLHFLDHNRAERSSGFLAYSTLDQSEALELIIYSSLEALLFNLSSTQIKLRNNLFRHFQLKRYRVFSSNY